MSSRHSRPRSAWPRPLRTILGLGARGVVWLGFWVAIALPLLYLPLLAVGWLDIALALVATHVATVCLGQLHPRDR